MTKLYVVCCDTQNIMECCSTNKLKAEICLSDWGFTRLYRWKINKKNYLIQLCPKQKHICVFTTNVIRSLMNKKSKCIECEGGLLRNTTERVNQIIKYEHLIIKLFQVIDSPKYERTQLWQTLHNNLACQLIYEKYLQSKKKYFNKGVPNSDDLSDSFDVQGTGNEKLAQANQSYFRIIVQLDKKISKLTNDNELLIEISNEREEYLEHMEKFMKLKGYFREFEQFMENGD